MKEFYENEIRSILSNYRLRDPDDSLIAKTVELAQKELIKAWSPASEKERWIFGILLFTGIMTVCMFYVLTIGSILWFSVHGLLEIIVKQAILAMSVASGSMIAAAVIITAWKLISQSKQNLRICADRNYTTEL